MPRAQKDGFTAPDYLKAAEDFAKEGDFESAFKAQATANQLVAYEQQYYAQKAQETQQQLVMAQFTDDLQKVIQKDPQAAWDTQSPLALEMNDLLNKNPKAIYFRGRCGAHLPIRQDAAGEPGTGSYPGRSREKLQGESRGT